jgi:methionine synthase I (cobalamin-dependent)
MVFFDGGMGTMLQKYGLSNSECPDYLNISHPEIVQRIHKEYEAAGCQFISPRPL